MKTQRILSIVKRPYARRNTGKTYPNGRPVYEKCQATDTGAELSTVLVITLDNGRTIVRNPYSFQQDCQNATLSCGIDTAIRNLIGCQVVVEGLEETTTQDGEGKDILSYDTVNLSNNLSLILSDRVIDKLDSGVIKHDSSSWELAVMEEFANRSATGEVAERISSIRHSFYANVKTTKPADDTTNSGKASKVMKEALESALAEK